MAGNKPTKIIELIEDMYYARRNDIRAEARKTGNIPTEWSDTIIVKDKKSGLDSIFIEFGGCWHAYEGKLEGYLVEGSYSFTENKFVGRQSFPNISSNGPNPGTHWNNIDKIPEDISKLTIVGALYGGRVSVKESLMSQGAVRI
ncbi:MAG: hypothetical protein WC856_21520 [Methylococcaceae bacterium]|jgi:hypothetical protein